MSTSWRAADVRCPFYVSDKEHKITCENILKKADSITHNFLNAAEQQRHMKRCCCDSFRKCIYYRVLSERYEITGH